MKQRLLKGIVAFLKALHTWASVRVERESGEIKAAPATLVFTQIDIQANDTFVDASVRFAFRYTPFEAERVAACLVDSLTYEPTTVLAMNLPPQIKLFLIASALLPEKGREQFTCMLADQFQKQATVAKNRFENPDDGVLNA